LSIVRDIANWQGQLSALPTMHPRRWGVRLLALGAFAVLVSVLLTPPWASIGLGACIAGALLARAPLQQALRLPWIWCGIAYALWIYVSCAIATFNGLEGARLRPPGPTWTWLAAPAVALGLADPRFRARVLSAVVIVLLVSVVLAVVQFCVGLGAGRLKIDPLGPRFVLARGFAELHLTFGLGCALLLVLASQRLSMLPLSPTSAWLLRSAAFVGLAVCGSRSALLGAAAGVWSTLSARGLKWFLLGCAIVVVGLAALAGRMLITEPNRAMATVHMQDGRLPIWRTSLHLISERPLTGWGGNPGFQPAFRDAYATVNPESQPEFPNGAPHAHNSALALASQFGVPALILHVAFWVIAMGWLWRRRAISPEAWQLGVGIVAVAVVGGLFESYATRVLQGVGIHAALGVALAIGLSSSKETPTE